jgi:hypothetical protein
VQQIAVAFIGVSIVSGSLLGVGGEGPAGPPRLRLQAQVPRLVHLLAFPDSLRLVGEGSVLADRRLLELRAGAALLAGPRVHEVAAGRLRLVLHVEKRPGRPGIGSQLYTPCMASARRIAVSMAVMVGVCCCMVFVSSVFVVFIIIHQIDF